MTDFLQVSAGNVLIPEGLLRNVNSSIYTYGRSDLVEHDSGAQTLAQIIQQPAQVAVTRHASLLRRQTLDDTYPRALPRRFGRASESRFSVSRSPGILRRRPSRAASINVATLLRRRRHSGWPASLVHASDFEGDINPGPAKIERYRAKSIIDDTSTARHSASHDTYLDDQPLRSWSPTHRIGRISVHSPDDLPFRQRQVSFLPGRESISVRRPTLTAEPIQAPFPPWSSRRSSSLTVSKTVRDRQSSIRNTFERARSRQDSFQRSKAFQLLFQYTLYLLILGFVYLVLVGRPLWGGTIWYIYLLFEYHLTFVGGSAIFVGLAFFYAFGPLLTGFEATADLPRRQSEEKSEKPYFPPAPFIRCFEEDIGGDRAQINAQEEIASDAASSTALLIPCYKSAGLLPATLEAALEVFPPTSIYILANGNSPTPLDNTEEVCTKYGVHHIWIPLGSKIIAQYVGSYVVRKSFSSVLLIDDDCLLPPNFPIVVDRLRGQVKCLGYTLTSIGPNRSRGTWCQQAQDLEYKLSGLQRTFAGKIGSATFPHGAIVLWDTDFLVRTFHQHPGFSVSEDWFFGHVARILGSRIIMCSSVFVETETPSSLFFAARNGERGGFGEMTVFKQRFKRWNFFFVNGCYYNLAYILFSWRLGFWEIGAKLFVFQEVYETLLYLITPIVLPISFFVRPAYTAYLFAGTLALYLLNSVLFNEVHLRRANQMVDRKMLYIYYMPFKLALTFVNVASCWWSLWQYAKYFAKKHPRIVDDVGAVGIVLKIQEELDVEDSDDTDSTDEKHDDQRRHFSQGNVARQPRKYEQRTSHAHDTSSRTDTPSSYQSTDSAGRVRKARRLTVTAVKVDLVPEKPFEDQRVGAASREGQSPENLASTDSAAEESRVGLSRRTSLSGGIFGQLNNWAPGWTNSVSGGHIGDHDGVAVLEQVDEVEDEDAEEVGGYSYYGT